MIGRSLGIGLVASLLAGMMALGVSWSQTVSPYTSWPILINPFPSTGGGGVMIDGYAPVIEGKTCITPFQAIMPDGAIYKNTVTFDAIAVDGGTLCMNGRWRSDDGSSSGTTPFQVFLQNGVVRRMP